MSAVAGLGCQACLQDGHPDTPATVHHSRTRPDGQKYGAGLRACHFETMGLCEAHHQGQLDTSQLAFHRNPQAFEARYGTELEILARVDEQLGIRRQRQPVRFHITFKIPA